MKESDQEQIDWVLIRKFIDGSIVSEERECLEVWMKGNEGRRHFVERACRYYRQDLPVVDKMRIERAWQHFIEQKRKQRRSFFVRWVWGTAASVALLAGMWLWRTPSEFFKVTKGVYRQEILVGSPRACLVTSDGSRIDIVPSVPKKIIVDQKVSVFVDSSSLSYTENVTMEDTIYHTVEVPRGGEFQLTLSDGSRVWLNAESRLTYPLVFGKGERRVCLEGEGYFEVEPGKGSFIVTSGEVSVRVLGTGFNVNAYEDEEEIRTTLVHGKVEVLTADDSLRQVLLPGEQAVLNRTNGRLKVKKVNTYLYTQWMRKQFVFRNAPLKEIMRSLSRWYQMDYEFTDSGLESVCFYGIIDRFDRVEKLLEQFEKTGKVHFEYQGNKVIIKK